MAAPPNTVATPEFQNLKPENLKPDLDPAKREQMFQHAMKIFLLSYPEFDHNMLDDEVYIDRFEEYMEKISELFDYQGPLEDLIEDRLFNLWTELTNLPIGIVVTVKKLMGRDKAAQMGLTVAMMNPATKKAETKQIDLDLTREEQLNKQEIIATTFNNLRVCKQGRYTLYIQPYGQNWAPDVAQQPLRNFTITFDRIHGEGYQQWFEFGRGIKVLFEITFYIRKTPQIVETKDFHMYAINHMLEKVIQRHTPANPLEFVWHKDLTRTNTYVTFERPAVDNKEDRFWRQMPYNEKAKVFEKLAKLANKKTQPTGLREILRHPIGFIDLQRDQVYGPDIEERVCLCSQFCNWTAFFHYNPIYRFVILQNSQLFFDFVGNVSDIYLFNVAELLTINNPINSYMFPLLHSANHYHQKTISEFYIPDANYRFQYDNSHPKPFDMSGATYNQLRNKIPVPEILGMLEKRPSGELVIRGLKQFSEVLSHLHHFCSLKSAFVPNNRQYVWRGEFAQVIHNLLSAYLPYIYNRVFNPLPLQTILPLNDYIFGSDIEYQGFIPKNEAETEVKYIRLKALQSGQNPLNVRVRLRPFFAAFIWFYKFVTGISPLFTLPENMEGWNIVDGQCVNFDRDFYAHFNGLNQADKNTLFIVTVHDLAVNGINAQMRPHFYALYTLKLYSLAQVIQRHCIKIRDKRLKRMENLRQPCTWEQFSDSFQFILNNEWIEMPYRSLINQNLFIIDNITLNHRIDQFYITYWGRAPHEVLKIPPDPDFIYCTGSALDQYIKHLVWLFNGGNTKKKLTGIRNTFVVQMRHHLTVAQNILFNFRHVYRILEDHKFAYDIETIDVLVIYMVRAICFLVIDNVSALFLRTEFSMETRGLVKHDMTFAMSKPGWIRIFETNRYAFEVLNEAQTQYIDNDDESERMIQSLEDSRMSVKAMYKHYHYYLCRQWAEELIRMHVNYMKLPSADKTQANEEIVADLMQMHLIFGVTFMARFHRSYRYTFYILRKILGHVINYLSDPNKQQLYSQRMRDSQPYLFKYVEDYEAVATTQVFDSRDWMDLLDAYMPGIQSIPPNNFGLDMAAANIA